MKLKTILLTLAGVIFSFGILMPSSIPAMAQPSGSGDAAQQGLDAIGGAFPQGARQANYDIQSVTKRVIDWALYIAAIVAVIYIIIGGYFYITSAGNATQAGKGKSTLVNALIGLTLIILSYVIVQIVYNFLTRP